MSFWKGFSGSRIWESCGLELMNRETWSTFSFLKLLFVFVHKVCLNCLPWEADWGAGSGFQSHTSCSREEAFSEGLRRLLHLSMASWSSHEVRIVDQRVNYGTVLIIVTVELVHAFIDIMRPNSKEKGVSNPAGQCKLFHVGSILLPSTVPLLGWVSHRIVQNLQISILTPQKLIFRLSSKYL